MYMCVLHEHVPVHVQPLYIYMCILRVPAAFVRAGAWCASLISNLAHMTNLGLRQLYASLLGL